MSNEERDRIMADLLLQVKRAESEMACLNEKCVRIKGVLHRAAQALPNGIEVANDGKSAVVTHRDRFTGETRETLDLPTNEQLIELLREKETAAKLLSDLKERERRVF